jgi:hypothetical protein
MLELPHWKKDSKTVLSLTSHVFAFDIDNEGRAFLLLKARGISAGKGRHVPMAHLQHPTAFQNDIAQDLSSVWYRALPRVCDATGTLLTGRTKAEGCASTTGFEDARGPPQSKMTYRRHKIHTVELPQTRTVSRGRIVCAMSSAMVPPRLKEVLAAFHMETDQMKVRQLEALDSEENRPIPVLVQAMTCRALHDLVR